MLRHLITCRIIVIIIRLARIGLWLSVARRAVRATVATAALVIIVDGAHFVTARVIAGQLYATVVGCMPWHSCLLAVALDLQSRDRGFEFGSFHFDVMTETRCIEANE